VTNASSRSLVAAARAANVEKVRNRMFADVIADMACLPLPAVGEIQQLLLENNLPLRVPCSAEIGKIQSVEICKSCHYSLWASLLVQTAPAQAAPLPSRPNASLVLMAATAARTAHVPRQAIQHPMLNSTHLDFVKPGSKSRLKHVLQLM